jgi:DNA-binding NarL/FixJ family response regulator
MKVLLVDDHPVILSALEAVIRGLGDDVAVISASGARQLRATLKKDADFDLLLLDLELGDADGFELLGELRLGYPSVPVVVVSASDRASDVIRAVDLGAMGFVPKRASNDMLFEALRLVMSGGIYVPPMTLGVEAAPPTDGDTVPDVMRKVGAAVSTEEPPAQMPSLDALGLTPRQADVLMHLLQDKPNTLIAEEMQVPLETVKADVAAVLSALGVNSRTQAVLAVSQMTQQQGEAIQAWKPTQR